MASEARQLALPGLAKDARQQPARRRVPSWTTRREREFCDHLIDAWNAAFKDHGARANKARGNYQAARRLFHWLHSPDNDGDPPMTEGDVVRAIELYARNEWTMKKCGGQFRSFRSFIDDAPDIIDKYLTKAGIPRGQGSPQQTGQARAAAYARELVEKHGLDLAARYAADLNSSLTEYVAGSLKRIGRRPPKTADQHNALAWARRLAKIVNAWESLDAQTLATYCERAGRGFEALHGRAVGTSLHDVNLRDAIGMALMLESKKGGR